MATGSDEEKNKRTDAVSPDSSPDANAPLHEPTPQSPPTSPNGGLRAWLCVLGAFFIFTNTCLSTKYYQMILSQGIVIGLGASLAVRAIGFISLGTLAVFLAILSRHKGPKSATGKAIFDFKAFTELPFLGFAVSLLIFVAFYIPLFYIPSYAIYSLKIDENLSFYLLAITNAGSFFGRTVPFPIANLVGSIQIIVFWTVAAVIVMFSWLGIHNEAGFIVFCIIWGFISGVLVKAPVAAVAHPTLSPPMSLIGTQLGMSWITAATGILVGPPIAGALVDINTDYFIKAIVFAGVVMAAGARYSMLGIASYENHHTSFPHANSLLEAGNCIPCTNNSGSRAIDPLVDLVSQQQPLPEIKRCISRYTTPHDCELADLNNVYSANTANALMYRVTASPTPPEPDLQSPPWQLDDIPAAQNGTILPPQLPRKNEPQHSTCSLCGCQKIASLDKTHNSITTSNKVQLRPTILQHSDSELPSSSSPVHSHAFSSTLASSSAAIDTFLTDGLTIDLAGYSLILVKKPHTTSWYLVVIA
ncbi:hypothetical protein BOTNAR_0252g00070 [Botryotinia narcissicola]|uniref:Major facilitator superfamily (MFS) profile domain-containing protein n=1 Tax=Botryotinia narcissicola TaxID=278944 RepID=A0A4Z1I0J3_9HELO|nr:hypothetical protein BOTNAR_0252g00070 [Botryotinia narcissicola]